MSLNQDDLIRNISGFSDEHLYALIGGSVHSEIVVPQSGHALVEQGKAFFKTFTAKLKDAVCESGGLRDQAGKVAKSQKEIAPIIVAWLMAQSNLGANITQVVAIYLSVLLSRVTLDAFCDGHRPAAR